VIKKEQSPPGIIYSDYIATRAVWTKLEGYRLVLVFKNFIMHIKLEVVSHTLSYTWCNPFSNLYPHATYNWLTKLTLWNRAVLERLTVLQPLMNFPAFYTTQRIIIAFTRAFDSFLFWATPIPHNLWKNAKYMNNQNYNFCCYILFL
jgi:hypothetical protein